MIGSIGNGPREWIASVISVAALACSVPAQAVSDDSYYGALEFQDEWDQDDTDWLGVSDAWDDSDWLDDSGWTADGQWDNDLLYDGYDQDYDYYDSDFDGEYDFYDSYDDEHDRDAGYGRHGEAGESWHGDDRYDFGDGSYEQRSGWYDVDEEWWQPADWPESGGRDE